VLANAAPRLFGGLAVLTDQFDEHLRHGGDERATLERDHCTAYNLLAAGTLDGALLRRLGIDLGGELRVFELMLPTPGAWLHAEVARELRSRGALAATGRERVRGLWPAECDLAAAAPPTAVVAAAPPTGITDAAGAVRAVHGLADAALRAGHVGVLSHTELLPERLLHASPHVARMLRARVIEPLDRTNGNTDLLTTLVTLVRCDRDRRRTAAELGVHRNTL